MEFCKAFNAQTQTPDKQGKPLPVVITVYEDRSFTFVVKTPPNSYLIKEAAKSEARQQPSKYRKSWQDYSQASRRNRQGQDV